MLRVILPVLAVVLIVSACGCLAHTKQPNGLRGVEPGHILPEIPDMPWVPHVSLPG